MKKVFIGIDNGVSGSVGIISPTEVSFFATPTFVEQDYMKKKSNITRIDTIKLSELLLLSINGYNPEEVIIAMERPMVNPKRFKASTSALRAWEATLITVEQLGVAYQPEDSKAWQKSLLPSGIKGSPELKKASLYIGNRLFPQFKDIKHPDRDGILLAEYIRRINTLNLQQ